MASKIFLDANLLLDFILKRDSYNEAKLVLDLVIAGKIQAFTTSSILLINGHYLTKFYGSDKTKELLLMILMEVTLIDITHETAIVALSSKFTDIEDALQYFTAIHHKIDYFISRDKQLKKNSIPTLPVYTPQEFIEEFSR
jgi:predicted nucleic acid-binding protein